MEPGNQETPMSHLPVTEINPIEKSRNQMIMGRDEIKELVELPLVRACEGLWDKGVRTLSSSANKKDVGSNAYIILDYGSMSPENQEIAQEMEEVIDYDGMKAVKLKIPIEDGDVSFSEVEQQAIELAERYKEQPATWIPTYRLEQMREIYAYDPDDSSVSVEDFEEVGFFYDPESGLFYLNEEHYLKANEES